MSPQILEASMLILFGCSWPVNIAKSVRAGTARGKSILYELIEEYNQHITGGIQVIRTFMQ